MVGSMLYEAAQAMLTRTQSFFRLKAWGLRIARRRGRNRAIVAVARKLANVLHRMSLDLWHSAFATRMSGLPEHIVSSASWHGAAGFPRSRLRRTNADDADRLLMIRPRTCSTLFR
jgi:hypothetical protein